MLIWFEQMSNPLGNSTLTSLCSTIYGLIRSNRDSVSVALSLFHNLTPSLFEAGNY